MSVYGIVGWVDDKGVDCGVEIDVDVRFRTGDVLGFELGVEYEVNFENDSRVDKYIKGEVDVDIY